MAARVIRDALGLVAVIDWTPIVVAIITLIGVLGAACINAYVLIQLRTPSGTSIGKQVENTHHLAIGTRNVTVAMAQELGVTAKAVTAIGDKQDVIEDRRVNGH